MAERKKDWFPTKTEDSYSASVTQEQTERILKRISRLKWGEQLLEDAEKTPRAKKFGERHYHWIIRGQSNFLHIVPVWSEREPRECRRHISVSTNEAERLKAVGIL